MRHIVTIVSILLAIPAFSQQGICGKVTWIAGNQMPGPDKALEQPQPIERVIHVHEVTTPDQAAMGEGLYQEIKSKLVAKGTSKADGSFRIALPPGEYSVFVKEAEGWFANSLDDRGRIQTVSVKPKKYAEINILVNYLAVY